MEFNIVVKQEPVDTSDTEKSPSKTPLKSSAYKDTAKEKSSTNSPLKLSTLSQAIKSEPCDHKLVISNCESCNSQIVPRFVAPSQIPIKREPGTQSIDPNSIKKEDENFNPEKKLKRSLSMGSITGSMPERSVEVIYSQRMSHQWQFKRKKHRNRFPYPNNFQRNFNNYSQMNNFHYSNNKGFNYNPNKFINHQENIWCTPSTSNPFQERFQQNRLQQWDWNRPHHSSYHQNFHSNSRSWRPKHRPKKQWYLNKRIKEEDKPERELIVLRMTSSVTQKESLSNVGVHANKSLSTVGVHANESFPNAGVNTNESVKTGVEEIPIKSNNVSYSEGLETQEDKTGSQQETDQEGNVSDKENLGGLEEKEWDVASNHSNQGNVESYNLDEDDRSCNHSDVDNELNQSEQEDLKSLDSPIDDSQTIDQPTEADHEIVSESIYQENEDKESNTALSPEKLRSCSMIRINEEDLLVLDEVGEEFQDSNQETQEQLGTAMEFEMEDRLPINTEEVATLDECSIEESGDITVVKEVPCMGEIECVYASKEAHLCTKCFVKKRRRKRVDKDAIFLVKIKSNLKNFSVPLINVEDLE